MNLPTKIKRTLRDYKVIDDVVSRLGGHIIKLSNTKGNIVYLKTGFGVAGESLIREHNVLTLLKNKNIYIPQILEFATNNDGVYIIISNVEGIPAHKVKDRPRSEVLKICADILKQFSSIKLQAGEKLKTLDDDLRHIENCMRLDLLNTDDFIKANNGKNPKEIYKYLLRNKDKFAEDVLVHGDFCMPNILISNNNCGLIDIGDCGIGDIYKDFSALEVSIKRNFGEEWIVEFYKQFEPKIEKDEMKIKYYQFIDQFGYHLNTEKYKLAYEQ